MCNKGGHKKIHLQGDLYFELMNDEVIRETKRESIKRWSVKGEDGSFSKVIEKIVKRNDKSNSEYFFYKNNIDSCKKILPYIYHLHQDNDYNHIYMEDVAEKKSFRAFKGKKEDYIIAAKSLAKLNSLREEDLREKNGDEESYNKYHFLRYCPFEQIKISLENNKNNLDLPLKFFGENEVNHYNRSMTNIRKWVCEKKYDENLENKVLCHGDPNRGNIFVSKKYRNSIFIDWETVRISPVGSDLGQLLYSSWWGADFSRIRNGNATKEVEDIVIDAYADKMAFPCLRDEIKIGLYSRVVELQLLKKFPSIVRKLSHRNNDKNVDKIKSNLSIILNNADILVDMMYAK